MSDSDTPISSAAERGKTPPRAARESAHTPLEDEILSGEGDLVDLLVSGGDLNTPPTVTASVPRRQPPAETRPRTLSAAVKNTPPPARAPVQALVVTTTAPATPITVDEPSAEDITPSTPIDEAAMLAELETEVRILGNTDTASPAPPTATVSAPSDTPESAPTAAEVEAAPVPALTRPAATLSPVESRRESLSPVIHVTAVTHDLNEDADEDTNEASLPRPRFGSNRELYWQPWGGDTDPQQIPVLALNPNATLPELLWTQVNQRLNAGAHLYTFQHNTPRHQLFAPVLDFVIPDRTRNHTGTLCYYDPDGRKFTPALLNQLILHEGRAWFAILYGQLTETFKPTACFLVDAAFACE